MAKYNHNMRLPIAEAKTMFRQIKALWKEQKLCDQCTHRPGTPDFHSDQCCRKCAISYPLRFGQPAEHRALATPKPEPKPVNWAAALADSMPPASNPVKVFDCEYTIECKAASQANCIGCVDYSNFEPSAYLTHIPNIGRYKK